MNPFTQVPVATPETAPYWDAAREGRLSLQHCEKCGRHVFYPRGACPSCGGERLAWTNVSGRARLLSYVINHRPLPGFEEVSPVIAIVELEEGPRMMTNVVGVEPVPQALPLDLALEVCFEERGGAVLPVFRPEGAGDPT